MCVRIETSLTLFSSFSSKVFLASLVFNDFAICANLSLSFFANCETVRSEIKDFIQLIQIYTQNTVCVPILFHTSASNFLCFSNVSTCIFNSSLSLLNCISCLSDNSWLIKFSLSCRRCWAEVNLLLKNLLPPLPRANETNCSK